MKCKGCYVVRESKMIGHTQQLGARSVAVLEMIAAGSSYEQILVGISDLTYLDIFRAASEALDMASHDEGQSPVRQGH